MVRPQGGAAGGGARSEGGGGACFDGAPAGGCVQLYTLRTHAVVHTLRFSSRVLSVRVSCRLLAVALDAQVCFGSRMLRSTRESVVAAACCLPLMQCSRRPELALSAGWWSWFGCGMSTII